uniref:Uncharacterized protein n=1 Tax=Strongyloides venezuelensis TaxID=75913 RepID=A0A0K0FBZ1_STRVS
MHGKIYTTLFAICCLINLVICGLLIYIMSKSMDNPEKPEWAIILSFSTFIFFTIALMVTFVIWRKFRKDILLILCVTFTVGQCLCMVVSGVAFYVDETYPTKDVLFTSNPYSWLEFHRFVFLSAVILLLPIYVCQLFVINRHSGREYMAMPTSEITGSDFIVRKNTPYINSQKKYEKKIVR